MNDQPWVGSGAMAFSYLKHQVTRVSELRDISDSLIGALALRWAAEHSRPRAILAADLRVVWLNDVARDLLTDGKGMASRHNRLVPTDHHHERDWHAFLEACDDTTSNFPLPCPNSDDHLIFCVFKIRYGEHNQYIAVSFHHASSDNAVLYAALDKIFDLTPAEHRTLLLMLDGETASAVASRSHVSVDTVRSHIRHIYMKMDVTSREGLFRKLRPYSLDFARGPQSAH